MSENVNPEEQMKFRPKSGSGIKAMFITKGSAGKNPVRLAQVLAAYETVIAVMGWENKPIAKLADFLSQYQASIDGGYHKDAKDVLIAEEVEKRRAERKGFTLSQH